MKNNYMKSIYLICMLFIVNISNSQTYDCDNVYLIINQKGFYNSGELVFQPKSGFVYYALDITVKSKSSIQISYNLFYFKLKDKQGYEYTPALCDLEPQFGSGYISLNEKARGFVVFEVPKSSSEFYLFYEPEIFSKSYKIEIQNEIKSDKPRENITPFDLIKRITNPIVCASLSNLNSDYADIFNEYIIDLEKKLIYNTEYKKFDKLNYKSNIHKGSFINPSSEEILLEITIESGLVENALNNGISLIYVFDKYSSIISGPFLYQLGNINDVIDIDENGLSEIYFLMENHIQSVQIETLEVFEKNFINPILSIVFYYKNFNNEILVSEFKYDEGLLIFNSLLYIYDNDKKLIETQPHLDEYKLENGKFYHIENENNLDWMKVSEYIYPEY